MAGAPRLQIRRPLDGISPPLNAHEFQHRAGFLLLHNVQSQPVILIEGIISGNVLVDVAHPITIRVIAGVDILKTFTLPQQGGHSCVAALVKHRVMMLLVSLRSAAYAPPFGDILQSKRRDPHNIESEEIYPVTSSLG